MDDKTILLIRRSFEQVAAIATPAAILFYGRLFQLEPSTRHIFAHADMREEGARLIAALGQAAAMLDRPDELLPAARALARRLELQPEHYGPLAAALEWMLEECLAEEFTAEVRCAWTRAHREVTAAIADRGFPAIARDPHSRARRSGEPPLHQRLARDPVPGMAP